MRLLWMCALVGSLFCASARATEGEWEKFDEFDGISLYKMHVPGNPVLKYRGDGVIDAPIGKVLTVVADTPAKPQWMARVKDAEVIETVSPREAIEYMHLHTPWPLTDRDVLYRVRFEVDAKARRVTLHYESVEDARKPVMKGRVRAQIFPSTLELTAIDAGKRTQVRAEAHADPKGALPKWLVNAYQKRMPRESLNNLMRRVADPSVKDHPLVAGFGK